MPPLAESPVIHRLWDFDWRAQPVGFNLTPQVTSWVDRPSIPPALSGLVFSKLGDVAWQRFRDFSRWPDGWAGPGSKAIAWGTYVNFERLIGALRIPTGRTPPSLFVTDDGFLALQWEARDGTTVSVTTHTAGADYFIESEGAEGLAEEIETVAQRLNRTWA
jgi:hypothetical protein